MGIDCETTLGSKEGSTFLMGIKNSKHNMAAFADTRTRFKNL